MKSRIIKIVVTSFLILCTLCLGSTTKASVYVGNIETESFYTLSDTLYDEETGKVSYQKVSYSKNTYLTTNCTELDASGGSVDVSNDAQYVFLPIRYLTCTDNTTFSMKYVNNGVKRIAVHAEYAAGISKGGVDYKAGYKFVCVNALSNTDSWNLSTSKSIDGYDVLSILFGNYAVTIDDFQLVGFRLYFDYALEVDSYREFEIYGYEVHEADTIPSFASDPKPARVSKLTSDDVEVIDNQFNVSGTATLKAKILDFSTDCDRLAINFNLSDAATIDFKLDDESTLKSSYGYGSHTAILSLDKANYSTLSLVINAVNTEVKINSFEFLSKPYVDSFSGSNYKITSNDGITTVKYDYKADWYKISAPIRKYNQDYDFLEIDLNLSHPIVIGIMIDNTYLRSHWSYTEPLAAGDHSFSFNLSGVEITASSSLNIYLDPAITDYEGIEGEKTVIFNRLEFTNSLDMPKATIDVASSFTFTYDGKGKAASGAITNSGAKLYYEYKLESLADAYYDTSLPVDAGVYDVRVVSPLANGYGTTYAYAKLMINKAQVNKPTSSAIEIDYQKNKIYYDQAVFLVSTDSEFTNVITSGGFVNYGITLYYKYIESDNYYESETASLELDKREAKFAVSINYVREMTKENIPATVEYSTDGLEWIVGNDKKVVLAPGMIYLFRTKATSSSFASEITYVAVNYRQQIVEDLVLEATTSTKITLKEVLGAEYRLSDTVWQDANEFSGLKAGTKVTVYMRMKGTATSYASEEVSLEVVVGQMPSNEPTEPTLPTEPVVPSEPKEEPTEPKGCDGSFAGSTLAILSLVTVVAILYKKKEE